MRFSYTLKTLFLFLGRELIDDLKTHLDLSGTTHKVCPDNSDPLVTGDLYMGGAGGITGPSYFKDVTVLDNDIVTFDNAYRFLCNVIVTDKYSQKLLFIG